MSPASSAAASDVSMEATPPPRGALRRRLSSPAPRAQRRRLTFCGIRHGEALAAQELLRANEVRTRDQPLLNYPPCCTPHIQYPPEYTTLHIYEAVSTILYFFLFYISLNFFEFVKNTFFAPFLKFFYFIFRSWLWLLVTATFKI